ncbi:DUF1028 domain-containing protein [Candidatus Bathyarchaeota archaeon]|nr:DUF1028 domain-containing protein [Candidatus Bathyarchaeota archaeon]
MTFSIVAVDRVKGGTGFAISSCSYDSGRVGRSEAGIGSIVSQAKSNMAFRRLFFEKLGEGLSPDQILDHFKEIDDDIEHRQVGMITLDGEALSFTGKQCAKWAGHRVGEDYACQGNILVGPEVVDRMTEAFASVTGPLYDRLFAALRAGDEAGGDARGKLSARLVVVMEGAGWGGTSVVVDISVEDHLEPVKELGRILQAGKNTLHCWTLVSELNQASGEDKNNALGKLETFLESRADRAYIDAWEALGSAQLEAGMKEKAVATYRKYLEISPRMAPLIRRLVAEGELPEEILE